MTTQDFIHKFWLVNFHIIFHLIFIEACLNPIFFSAQPQRNFPLNRLFRNVIKILT